MVSGNTLILEKGICSHLVHLEDMSHLYSFFPWQGQFAFFLVCKSGQTLQEAKQQRKMHLQNLN